MPAFYVTQGLYNAWKLSAFGAFPVSTFPHSDSFWKNTAYLSVFSPNAGK